MLQKNSHAKNQFSVENLQEDKEASSDLIVIQEGETCPEGSLLSESECNAAKLEHPSWTCEESGADKEDCSYNYGTDQSPDLGKGYCALWGEGSGCYKRGTGCPRGKPLLEYIYGETKCQGVRCFCKSVKPEAPTFQVTQDSNLCNKW